MYSELNVNIIFLNSKFINKIEFTVWLKCWMALPFTNKIAGLSIVILTVQKCRKNKFVNVGRINEICEEVGKKNANKYYDVF